MSRLPDDASVRDVLRELMGRMAARDVIESDALNEQHEISQQLSLDEAAAAYFRDEWDYRKPLIAELPGDLTPDQLRDYADTVEAQARDTLLRVISGVYGRRGDAPRDDPSKKGAA
jgi:hypothetical protein